MTSQTKSKKFNLKKLLSYVWPFTSEVATDHNGELYLTLVNGRKTLNSKNANYSFGSLQQIMEFGLSRIDLKNTKSLLLLGLGGGSVIVSLRNKFKYEGKIVAVELDNKVIELAKNEFFISAFPNLTIHNSDAFEFVKQSNPQYDLVIVDLFFDNVVPPQFYSEEFCQNLSSILSEKGSILFNLGINEIESQKRAKVVDYFSKKENFTTSLYEKVVDTNFLMVADKLS